MIMAKISFGDDGSGANIAGFSFDFLQTYNSYAYHFSSISGYTDDNNRVSFTGDKLIYKGTDGGILLDPTQQGKEMADIVGGAITSFTLIQDGVQIFNMRDLRVSAAELYDAVMARQNERIKDILLSGNDMIDGTRYDDVLQGRGGNDALNGFAANDKLEGGIGADILTGGAGRDTFVYRNLTDSTAQKIGRDTITDFEATKTGDKIHLSLIDANIATAKNDAFQFIGTKAFSGHAGELRYQKTAADTYVYADVNGDKVADFGIHLDGALTLDKGFFVL